MSTAPADLERYANQFDELQVEERTSVIELNANSPLSNLREDWQNTTSNQSEHQLSTAANTNDTAYLETVERGNYTAGYQVQTGVGVRVPTEPTGDSEMRWGYYTVDTNGDPLNGFYFGVDADGIFVAKARDGAVEKVRQDSWNRDQLDGTGGGGSGPNPSERTLDLGDGHVFQVEFVYYGYGGIQMQILMDGDLSPDATTASSLVTAHVFQPSGETSIENPNLPLRQEIESGGTANDALDLYVGGRQVSIIGAKGTSGRITGHYRASLSAVDDTKWYAAISFRIKDGTDIGSIDFRHLLIEMQGFSSNPDATAYRWQIRRGTTPDAPTWENPSSAEDNQDETGLKVDVSSADVQDGSGNLTGVNVDSGTLAGGEKNKVTPNTEDIPGQLAGDEVATLLFKAVPGSSGTISDIYFKVRELW